MDKTKLDQKDAHHRLLIALMATFVTDYGYTTRELFKLLENSKSQLFHALQEMEREPND